MPKEFQDLIKQLSSANIGWGVPRIVGELRKLGIHVAKSTVEKYRVKHPKSLSPSWKSFLANQPTILLVSLTIFAGLPGVALAFKQPFHEQITEEILKAQGFDVDSADQVGDANWYTDFREAFSDAAHADNNQLGADSTRLRSKRTDIGDTPTLGLVTFKDAPDNRSVICVRVRNVGAADTTYSLQALSSLGWAVDGPSTVTVAAAGFADVTFSVQVPPDAAEGSVSEVTILAEDTTSPIVRNSATVSVRRIDQSTPVCSAASATKPRYSPRTTR